MAFIHLSEKALIQEYVAYSSRDLKKILKAMYGALRIKLFFSKHLTEDMLIQSENERRGHLNEWQYTSQKLTKKPCLANFLQFTDDEISKRIQLFELILMKVKTRENRMMSLRPRK